MINLAARLAPRSASANLTFELRPKELRALQEEARRLDRHHDGHAQLQYTPDEALAVVISRNERQVILNNIGRTFYADPRAGWVDIGWEDPPQEDE